MVGLGSACSFFSILSHLSFLLPRAVLMVGNGSVAGLELLVLVGLRLALAFGFLLASAARVRVESRSRGSPIICQYRRISFGRRGWLSSLNFELR